jgi:hypothetical protein
MVKQIIHYNDGTTSTTEMSIDELQKFDFSEKMYRVVACTYQTPNLECTSTAATCSEALGKFAKCLCKKGYDKWCEGNGETPPKD